MGHALPPETLLDHYRIQRVLSASGFSAVYLAKDVASDLWVIIKEYLPTNLVEQTASSRAVLRGASHTTAFKRGKFAFLSESRALASCDHPSLLKVNRLLDLHGTVYRVMPRYEGKSLQSVRQEAPQAPDEASLRSLLDGLLGALEVLHEQEYVHGAISPDNILLLSDDQPLLMDFSAVRRAVVSPETQRLMSILEPSYQATEQIQPRPPEAVPGPWSDVYSVGAVLYFCIAGELPRRGKREPIAAVVRRLEVRQPGLRYSEAFLAAIDAALQENLQERSQSVAEFRRMLEAAPSSQISPPVQSDDDLLGSQAHDPELPSEMAAGGSGQSLPLDSAPSLSEVRPLFATGAAQASDDGIRPRLRAAQLPQQGIERRRVQLKSRALVCTVAAFMLGGVGFAAWKVNEQRQAEQLLAEVGAAALAAFPRSPLRSYSLETWPAEAGLLTQKVNQEPPSISPLEDPAVAQVDEHLGKELSVGENFLGVPGAGRRSDETRSPKWTMTPPVPAAKEPSSPIEACEPRTNFALYKCMKTQCDRTRWRGHLQCQRLRDTDEVIR